MYFCHETYRNQTCLDRRLGINRQKAQPMKLHVQLAIKWNVEAGDYSGVEANRRMVNHQISVRIKIMSSPNQTSYQNKARITK